MITHQLKLKRKNLGLSQQRLAELAGVSLPTIQTMESGRANPSLEILIRISKVVGLGLVLEATPVDWDLLATLGIPLSTNNKSKINPTAEILILELRKALVISINATADRKVEALAATLLALKSHWPSIFKKLGTLREAANQLIAEQDLNRLLKLRSLASESLQVYL